MKQEQAVGRKRTEGQASAGRHSFVVRLWREEGEHAWQGSVQHVGSGVEVRIVNLSQLLAFIERWIDRHPSVSEAACRRPQPPAPRLK